MALARSAPLVALLVALPLAATLAIPGGLAGREVVAIPSLRWPLLALVAIAALAGRRAWAGVLPAPPTDLERRGGWWALSGVLAFAAVLRLVGLEDYPRLLDEDEARNAIMAFGLMARGGWTPTDPGTGIETLFLYMIAGCVKVFGFSIASVRLAGALCSIAQVAGTFLLARELFGRRVGLVAAGLCTISTWTCFTARAPLHVHWVAALVGVSFAALARSLRTGRGWLVTGLLFGLSVHSFSSYRHGLALALIAVGVRAWMARGTADAPVGLARGAKWLALGVAIPVLAAVPSALAGGYADWWLIVREQSVLTEMRQGKSAWDSIVPHLGLIGSHLAMVRIAERLDLGLFHGMLIAATLPWLFRLRDPRFQLLLVMLVGLVLPPLAAKEDLLAWRRFMALVAPMFTLEALCVVELARRAGPRERLVIVALAGAHAVMLLGSTVRDLAASGSRDEPRQAVMRSAWRYAGPEKILVPPGFTGGVKSLEYFLLDPRLGELIDGDPFATEDPGRDVLYVAVRTRVFAEYSRGESTYSQVPSDRFGTIPLRVQAFARDQWPLSAGTPGAVGMMGDLHIPRAGLWRIATADVAVSIGGTRVAAGASVDVALDRGLVPYRFDGSAGARLPQLRRLSSGFSPPPRWFPPPPDGRASYLHRGEWDPDPIELWRSAPVRGDPRSLSRNRERVRVAVQAQAACTDGRTAWVHAGGRVEAVDVDTLGTRVVAMVDPAGNPMVLAQATMPDRPRTGALAYRAGELVLAQIQQRSVTRHDLAGRFLGALQIENGWREPVDVAIAPDGRVAVADRARGEVAVFTPSLELEQVIRVDEPLAVCFAAGSLFAIDGARLSLVRLLGNPPETMRYLGRVAPRARLAGGAAGTIAVLLPDSQILRLYDAGDLALLAPRGDPAPYDDRMEPVAAAWDAAGERLVLVEASGDLSVMRWR